MPDWRKAEVPQEKIVGYVLSATHLRGKDKARLFFALGYTVDNWQRLRGDLITVARTGEARPPVSTPHGTKIAKDGVVVVPAGRPVNIRTAWIVDPNSDVPTFLTAFPR